MTRAFIWMGTDCFTIIFLLILRETQPVAVAGAMLSLVYFFFHRFLLLPLFSVFFVTHALISSQEVKTNILPISISTSKRFAFAKGKLSFFMDVDKVRSCLWMFLFSLTVDPIEHLFPRRRNQRSLQSNPSFFLPPLGFPPSQFCEC